QAGLRPAERAGQPGDRLPRRGAGDAAPGPDRFRADRPAQHGGAAGLPGSRLHRAGGGDPDLGDRPADAGVLQPGPRFRPAPVRLARRLGPRRPAGAEWRPRLHRLHWRPRRGGAAGRRALSARFPAPICPARHPPDPRQGPRRPAGKDRSRMRRALLLSSLPLLLAVLPVSPAAQKPPARPALDPDLPYQARRSSPVTYDVDFSAIVTAPYHTKKLRVWLPLPQSDSGQEVEEVSLGSFPTEVK